nr:MAG TPA: hypothetical protein [Caudoviricetes sp.]
MPPFGIFAKEKPRKHRIHGRFRGKVQSCLGEYLYI